MVDKFFCLSYIRKDVYVILDRNKIPKLNIDYNSNSYSVGSSCDLQIKYQKCYKFWEE